MDINIVSVMLYSTALVPIAFSITFALLVLKIFTSKSLRSSKYPPVHGTVFGQLVHFNWLYDYQMGVARRTTTYQLLALGHSAIYMANPMNIKYMLKTKLEMYTKGKSDIDVAMDLFGEGIFTVDGEKWKKQRKVASFDFATRVLRDFSCCVFRKNSAKLDCFMERITNLVLDQMHYFHATLTETLRLYPAVPLDGRCAETDDVLPNGFHVKNGDGVHYLAYSMARMHNIWGEDAEDFKPERWLKDGIFQNESPYKFVAFHAGPRICLRKDFSYCQMKIVSIALLHFFRFRLADETKPVTYKVMFTLHIDNGLYLCAAPRLADNQLIGFG